MKREIHSSAVIGEGVEIDGDVFIGPYCVLSGDLKVGSGCRLDSHVVLGCDEGRVRVGQGNRFGAGTVIGTPPQDLSSLGHVTSLEIGSDNWFRELSTVNIGTQRGAGTTRIGSHGMFMTYSHIAHDCQIGDHVVMANLCQLAGHVSVEDNVRIGGMVGVNQFVRIGRFAFVAGDSSVNKDILPFSIAQGKYAVMRAANTIGLERAGFPKDTVDAISRSLRVLLKGSETLRGAQKIIDEECGAFLEVREILHFIKNSGRGVALP